MRYPFVFMILFLVALGCKSKISYLGDHYLREEANRKIPYQHSFQKDNTGKLLLILPNNPDTLDVSALDLMTNFKKNGYHIVIAGKPGEDVYRQREIDSREDRIADVNAILLKMDSLWASELILFGIGEGAQILPNLAPLKTNVKMILINSGLYSPLHELEFMATEEVLSKPNQEFLARNNLSQEELLNRVRIIGSSATAMDQMAPSSNRCWLSYYRKPLLNELTGNTRPTLWINYQDYSMISQTGFQVTESIIVSVPKVTYHTFTGQGNLNDPRQSTLLNAEIKRFLDWN